MPGVVYFSFAGCHETEGDIIGPNGRFDQGSPNA
jgi:hypothetical protein